MKALHPLFAEILSAHSLAPKRHVCIECGAPARGDYGQMARYCTDHYFAEIERQEAEERNDERLTMREINAQRSAR